MIFRLLCITAAIYILNNKCCSGSIPADLDYSKDVKNNDLQVHCPDENCGRNLGSLCSHNLAARCRKGLICRYHKRSSQTGICIVPKMKACLIGARVYKHGEKFSLDCRTRCVCVNGTYACASRCPNEKISPRGSCYSPRLIYFPGHCCRQWLCDSPTATVPPKCVEKSTPWSECSSSCGAGISTRTSNANPSCDMRKETRLCQRKSCTQINAPQKVHRLRRKHACKATQRWSRMHLKLDSCVSHRRYAPRHCGPCPDSDMCCKPMQTKTISVAVKCDSNTPLSSNETESILVEWAAGYEDLWKREDTLEASPAVSGVVKVEWVLKCKCSATFCNRRQPKEALLHRVHRASSSNL